MRKRVLDDVHSGHQGVTNMQSRLENECWWPNINKDLDDICSSCGVLHSVMIGCH